MKILDSIARFLEYELFKGEDVEEGYPIFLRRISHGHLLKNGALHGEYFYFRLPSFRWQQDFNSDMFCWHQLYIIWLKRYDPWMREHDGWRMAWLRTYD